MMLDHARRDAVRPRLGAAFLATMVALLSTGLLLPLSSAQAATAVPLGTAESFAILGGSTITNTGASVVTGDIGLHPGTAVTGFAGITHNGSLYVADGVALQAKNDLTNAYTNAAGQVPVTTIPTELGGATLTAGSYDSAAGTFGVTGTLTLDGEGDPNAVFIFKMASTLTTASASSVSLIGDADPCNVFWQVGSSATLGSNSTFRGTIMADQSITLTTGAVVQGRVLAREGAVTLDSNTITVATCATPVVDDTPVADDTPTEDDTPVADDTPTEDDTPVADDTPTEDDTTAQVPEVPTGAVAAGGHGVDTALGGRSLLLAGLLLFGAMTVAAGIANRRRSQV